MHVSCRRLIKNERRAARMVAEIRQQCGHEKWGRATVPSLFGNKDQFQPMRNDDLGMI